MKIALLIALIILTLILFLFRRLRKDNTASFAEAADPSVPGSREYAMETRFYEEIRGGKRQCYVARVYSQFDVMFLKSMLDAEAIPFHVEYEHMGSLKSGAKIDNYSQMLVSVLDDDYGDAYAVIDEYIANKNKYPEENRAKNVMESVMLGWYVPVPPSENTVELISRPSEPAALRGE
ncbi:hypothetical protein LJC14_02905 [Treponema sp. OttesenSCG-928-L16]|nr:hypothetical protein [Treponema sp. OttesenSCG-928-L16]